jgi:hypothetical protein
MSQPTPIAGARDEQRERAIEFVRFLAWLTDDPLLRADYLGWADRLTNPTEPLEDLETLRHACFDALARLQSAVVQDEPLPHADAGEARDHAPEDGV